MRSLVEECLVLDAGTISPARRASGATWRGTLRGPLVGQAMEATHIVHGRSPGPLVLTVIGARGDRCLTQSIALTFLDLPWGGRRSYFRCPGSGAPCGRRALKLYWPGLHPAGFACRRCHQLVYRSTRQPSRARRWGALNRIGDQIASDTGIPVSALLGPGLRATFGGTKARKASDT